MKQVIIFGLILLSISVTHAHDGVKNPAVKARMDGMSAIAANMKILGHMANGKAGFDQKVAKAALAKISVEATKIPDLFKARETDPKSEATDAIWSDFEDFSKIAKELETITASTALTITAPDNVKDAMRSIGANCKACHAKYRR